MKRKDVFQNCLYGILLSAFLILYFLLSMNNRLAADDYYFLNNLQRSGFWQSMIISWQTWVTRWTSILFLNAVLLLFKLSGNFLFFHIITLLTLCFALYRFTSALIMRMTAVPDTQNRFTSVIADLPRHSRFAVALLISFFFLSPGTGETFFWITSTSMYLWSFIALCFLAAEIMYGSQSVLSGAVCILAAAFIGGACEAFALPAALALLFFCIMQWRKKKFSATAVLSLIVMVNAIAISYAGHGRELRQSALPQVSALHGTVITLKAIVKAELFLLKKKWWMALLLFFVWAGFSEKLSAIRPERKLLFKILIAYCSVSILFLFPACFLLGETPPFRTWMPLTLINSIALALAGLYAGTYFEKRLNFLTSSAAILMLTYVIINMAVDQNKITGEYARAVDARMQFLTTLVNPDDSSTVILEPLPESGLLTSSEISPDTNDFRNQHLKKFLGMKAALRVRQNN